MPESGVYWPMKSLRSLFLVGALSPAALSAAALSIPEYDAEGLALASSTVAREGRVAAIADNPAGLSGIADSAVAGGLIAIMPKHDYRGRDARQEGDRQTFLPAQAYAAQRVQERVVMGLGVYAPYGLGSSWPGEWEGRYQSTEAELQVIAINPALALRLGERLHLGVGLRYLISSARIARKIDTGLLLYSQSGGNPALQPTIANPAYDSDFTIDGDAEGWQFACGGLYKLEERLTLGASFISGTEMTYTGRADFTHSAAWDAVALAPGLSAGDQLAQALPDQPGEARLNLPWHLNLAAHARLTPAWDLSLDGQYTAWSVYEDITIDLAEQEPTVSERNWSDSWALRLGISYQLGDGFCLRAGALYDRSPVPDQTIDPQLPDSDRVGLGIGCGWERAGLHLDAAYLYLRFFGTEKNNRVGVPDIDGDGTVGADDQQAANALAGGRYPIANGSYDGDAHLVALTLRYLF